MKRKVQVVILTENPENELEVLVLKTNKDRGAFWQNVTGSVNSDESFQEAAYRELMEETGINSKEALSFLQDLDTEFFFDDRKNRKVQERVYFYHGPRWDIQICKEHTEYEWLEVNKIDAGKYKYPSNYHALEKSLKKITKDQE